MIDFLSDTFLEVVAIIIGAFLIGYVLPWALIKAGRKAGVSRAQLLTLRKWVRVLAIVLGVVGVVNALGAGSQVELLTLGGLAALIFSLAMQGFIASMIAGFLSFGQGTVRHGDIVEVAGAGKGRIVKVNLRNVWIKTDNGAMLVIDHVRLEHGRFWNYTAAERLEKRFDKRNSIA